MRKVLAEIKSCSPLSWSRRLDQLKKPGEDDHAMEERLWRDRFWTDDQGTILVPEMAIKNSLVDAAAYRGEKIAGKNMKTWTEKFKAGVLCFEPMLLGVTKDALDAEWRDVPASPGKGKRGMGQRVLKCFPRLLQWSGIVSLLIVEDSITETVFRDHLETVGKFIGWGRFRPINGGYYGRFEIADIQFVEE
jgi:hypothetical protein